ncbi:hypothetical protein GOD58_18240 [Sinorhizobium medicae]|nr:hypothetical protein [Sinorhizobium medicae]MDX0640351.1 hypothetical protein [Sinorhizobium medicae]MDX0850136.1 hypothetical protein [Sinorhizobium medicae]MDX1014861.1 hypothetical protein [Sinorhizobium medicae]
MSFENFKLLPKQKPDPTDATTKRRLRFLSQIEKQIGFVTSDPDRKRRGQWFWKTGDGSYVLSVRYGRRDIELSKGKFAVSCADGDAIVTALQEVKRVALEGGFDDQLTRISGEIRRSFKK